MQCVTSVSWDFLYLPPKNDKWYVSTQKKYSLLRLRHSSRWRKRSAGTVSLSPSFAVIYLKFFFFFRAAASYSTSKTAGGLCALAAAELGHQIQSSQRTVAAASLALMKTHNFCPSCDSVHHQREDQGNNRAKITGSIPCGPAILK